VLGRVAGRFARVELQRRARALWAGCLRTCRARTAGRSPSTPATSVPTGQEHLLARAVWDEDAVRDDVRGYVAEHLGDPEAVLVVDETGDLKKGTATVGVQRQYTGTAGRVESPWRCSPTPSWWWRP
jgi:SRSO17 transposase